MSVPLSSAREERSLTAGQEGRRTPLFFFFFFKAIDVYLLIPSFHLVSQKILSNFKEDSTLGALGMEGGERNTEKRGEGT